MTIQIVLSSAEQAESDQTNKKENSAEGEYCVKWVIRMVGMSSRVFADENTLNNTVEHFNLNQNSILFFSIN